MRQYEYEVINFKIRFCFLNISAPDIAQKFMSIQHERTDLSFQEKKNDLKIRCLVTEILSEHGVLFFWDTLYIATLGSILDSQLS